MSLSVFFFCCNLNIDEAYGMLLLLFWLWPLFGGRNEIAVSLLRLFWKMCSPALTVLVSYYFLFKFIVDLIEPMTSEGAGISLLIWRIRYDDTLLSLCLWWGLSWKIADSSSRSVDENNSSRFLTLKSVFLSLLTFGVFSKLTWPSLFYCFIFMFYLSIFLLGDWFGF